MFSLFSESDPWKESIRLVRKSVWHTCSSIVADPQHHLPNLQVHVTCFRDYSTSYRKSESFCHFKKVVGSVGNEIYMHGTLCEDVDLSTITREKSAVW